ncbi:MAG TPA: FMN-binding protein [Candidatus Tetragenococcus pullicola]|nr:FMN-binding protein [Candidatus Tetragenococcus pullicola]
MKKVGFIMKTKKFMTGFAALAFSAIILGACSPDENTAESSENSSEASTSEVSESTETEESSSDVVSAASLQDGTYTLEEKNDKNGYHAVFSLTAKDGAITDSQFDYVDADGKSKKDDDDYNTSMKEKSGIAPEEFIPKFNDELLDKQNPSNIEVVSGATHSFHSFQNYAQQLIQAAQAGETDAIEIDNGADLQDGTYTLEEKNYSHGYRTVFSIVVKDGKVTESDFDNVNEAGDSKKDDADYNTSMKDQSGTNPETYIPELNDELVQAMGEEEGTPGDVEVVSGATESSHTFVLYAQQLINAAEKGDTETITVDNFVSE